ncbi:DUF2207 domain-containing protein [uncultured Cedecea sp.]|uniref:DUF2207 domain-containing protein n=1 Tax=uncultured Cedecea sp. TaxID=988762 RepID=UPI0026124DD9|nr:DUF2207 domain-containing protein [uncultured Cedecea sp.]
MVVLSRWIIGILWGLLLLVTGTIQALADADSFSISPARNAERSQPISSNSPNLLRAHEHIISFDTRAHFNTDGSMEVSENIKVLSLGKEIKRGIFRTLPLTWNRQDGKIFKVNYHVKAVLRDGVPEPFSLDKTAETLTVRIGSSERMLQPAIYNYEVRYQVSNHFSRFYDWDELYWNVTGNGWGYPIAQASFQLELPDASHYLNSEGMDTRLNSIDIYSGINGAREQNARILPNGAVQTTQPLGKGEGLTVVFTWSRDVLAAAEDPQAVSPLVHLLLPTLATIALWIPALLMIIYCLWWWRKNVTAVGLKMPVVVPLYTMPADMSPGYLRFLTHHKYDDVAFSSDLLALVAKGCVAITVKKTLNNPWLSKFRSLDKQWLSYQPEKKNQRLTADDKHLLGLIFYGDRKNINLSLAHQRPMQNARKWLSARNEKQKSKLFRELARPIRRAIYIILMLPVICGALFSPATAVMTIPALICWSFGIAMLSLPLSFLLDPRRVWDNWGLIPLVFALLFGSFIIFGGGFFLFGAIPLTEFPAGYVGALIFSILLCIGFALKLPRYTQQGLNDLAVAKGLKLYLGTAERHRYQILYPPDQRISHFESLLPAALALGVGKTWANTFAKYLSQSGAMSEAFADADWKSMSRFSRSCSSSSMATPSRSSSSGSSGSGFSSGSGSSGRGSSGGGSGGGGGGGW